MTYGSAFVQSTVGPRLMLRACSSGASACSAPKKYAPTRQSSGRQKAKMTSAIAIQPAPPVIPSTHCGVIGERHGRAGDAGERAAGERVRVPVGRDVDAHGVGRRRRLADRAHVQARPCPRQVQPDGDDAEPREVDEDVLAEQDRPDDRESCIPDGRNAWNVLAAGWSARLRSLPRYDDSPAAPAKIVSARPDTIWFARSVMTRNAWIAAMTVPANAATASASTSVAAVPACTRGHRPEAHDGADEHHPLDAEVEHAGALREQLAERGEEKRRPVGDAGGDEDDEERVVHAAGSGVVAGTAALGVRRVTRMR